MNFEPVIGIEVHTQLKTNSKLFSGAATQFGQTPNSQTCYIDAALPGTLPVLNQEAVFLAIRFGLAINATINPISVFERKNYFYPDLPKGYQISQYQHPIVKSGQLEILTEEGIKIIDIERAHLEEDAGKSIHDNFSPYSSIDLNRAGTPLLEIVTTPCIYSADQAIHYLKTLHQLLRFMEISDANMQEGSFRADINISIRPKGKNTLGTKVEIKNLNSFKFIEAAIHYETNRQIECLENNQIIIQETRLYNPDKNITISMRTKENANDYRYFPDPDLLPIQVTERMIGEVKLNSPTHPRLIKEELSKQNIPAEDINFLLSSPDIFLYYSNVKAKVDLDEKTIINWLKGPIQGHLNQTQGDFSTLSLDANQLAEIIKNPNLNSNQQKQLIKFMLENNNLIVTQAISHLGFDKIIDPQEIRETISAIIKNNPQQVQDYKNGKTQLLGFFMGILMKTYKGQINPNEWQAVLIEMIEN